MNNGLLLVMLPEQDMATLMDDAEDLDDGRVEVNVDSMRVRSRHLDVAFSLASRHRRMLLEGHYAARSQYVDRDRFVLHRL